MYPFDYPTQTVFYLVLYGATLVLHVLPMNYGLAGSTYLALLGVWEAVRGPALTQRPIVEVLRDWMPFALGVTITAAVAPLLVLQIPGRLEPAHHRPLALAHHIDEPALERAYRSLRRDAAVGVDGITVKQYGEQLEANLQAL